MSSHKSQQPGQQGLTHIICFLFLGLAGFLFSSPAIAQGTGKKTPSFFQARLLNIEAAANETFRYNAQLHNGGTQSRIYELSAQAPAGWNVAFKVDGIQISSFNLDSGKTQDISIEINPSPQVKPGKYPIPATAVSGQETVVLNLEAVVKGVYGVELTTPTGRLSDEITEGSSQQIHLVVKNTGTITLDNLELSAQAPSKWEATFVPSKIEHFEGGKTLDVVATLKVPDKTIAGDYITAFTVRNASSSATASFRMTVKTSALTGWLGLLIILLAIGLVYYLIRKYGRR